ncbi:hypothetical protein [Fusibacillus kribbianus]|uniref:Uncharacterized protein n=1 Tax=Fusibacillus kribbianus TaxID=3044208 RepID=A0AAP4EY73_9FIRM|nr:hypothetical protein [Ruminococcus sp. YH-rum2234]MDI9242622.1 hypothetical protein [Ruminococcus sp. YH-rum2234]
MKAVSEVMFLGVSSRQSGSKTYYNVSCKADDGLHSFGTREPENFNGLDDGCYVNLELNIFPYRGQMVVVATGAQLVGGK